eukprot:Sspe_Gene.93543::Locus_66151_Transcript_2_2_Confidence_0.500_Length_2246::g.93543::m.93543/K13755/PDE1; calcium/calmodulin-dependent 3',5'-cyclic nucleotide phosphodiesterase
MGCIVGKPPPTTTERPPNPPPNKQREQNGHHVHPAPTTTPDAGSAKDSSSTTTTSQLHSSAGPPVATSPSSGAGPPPTQPSSVSAAGKDKYLSTPLVRDVDYPQSYSVICYASGESLEGLVFAVRHTGNSVVWKRTMTDSDICSWKESVAGSITWTSFWRAIHNAFARGGDLLKVVVPQKGDNEGSKGGCKLEIGLKSSKDPQRIVAPVPLELAGDSPFHTSNYFILPFMSGYKKRKADPDAQSSEEYFEAKEAILNPHESTVSYATKRVKHLMHQVETLRHNVAHLQHENVVIQAKADAIQYEINQEMPPNDHWLDGLYSRGGARFFSHTQYSRHHHPLPVKMDKALLALEAEKFQGCDDLSQLTTPPTDPTVRQLLDESPTKKQALEVMKCMVHIDKWDFNAIMVDELTQGHSLLHIACALTFKYDLVRYFNIPTDVLFNFWGAVMAGYHPNPYHNSAHAADVLQVTHYILGPGKMSQKVKLTKEDQFAAIIAAGIHDYDHPGLNNSFHTKTQAYLSTLYNDRSVLENHHCACAFELMRHPQYDLLGSLAEDQRKDVRDTIVEMLLSTDMGNHGKIMAQFRRRVDDFPVWHSRKDDQRLCLVMAIKMADISNCGRPLNLYMQWAERIALEFYMQGDMEAALKVPISPFMDRHKHLPDFPRGQRYFMNYIVSPLFTVCTELLPDLAFVEELIDKNRSYWIDLQ